MVIYNKIIPFKGYVAMTFFPFIFARKKPLSSVELNHETIHLYQQLEFLIIALLVDTVLMFSLGLSLWWYFAIFPAYYLFYVLEYVVRLILYGNHREAYRNISFEQEAYLHEGDLSYKRKREPFAWLQYLTKKSF